MIYNQILRKLSLALLLLRKKFPVVQTESLHNYPVIFTINFSNVYILTGFGHIILWTTNNITALSNYTTNYKVKCFVKNNRYFILWFTLWNIVTWTRTILQQCCFKSQTGAKVVMTTRTIGTMFIFFVPATKADVM